MRHAPARRVLFVVLAGTCGIAAGRRVEAQAGASLPVVLQLRPRAGDQLRLRLDQTIEMGLTRRSGEDSLPGDVTSLVFVARLQVESADVEGSTVLATADSVRVEGAGISQSDVLKQALAMQGQRVRFRVAPDGGMLVTGADVWSGASIGAFLSQLPGTLPREPIAPGATWNRSVDIPLAATPDGRSNATLTASFRFDSLSPMGEFAYLSMKGRLIRSGPMQGGGNGGGFVQTSGTVTATLILDRRRGWIADARTLIALRSLVAGSGRAAAPARVRLRITQWMRVL